MLTMEILVINKHRSATTWDPIARRAFRCAGVAVPYRTLEHAMNTRYLQGRGTMGSQLVRKCIWHSPRATQLIKHV